MSTEPHANEEFFAVTASDKSSTGLRERVLLNRVEYADGSVWQRRDWDFGEIKMSYKRAIETPWEGEMCRGLETSANQKTKTLE